MKLLFSVKSPVQTFQVQEDIFPQDLQVLKAGISRFFESNPEYVVIDLSQASLQVSDTELQAALLEIKTLAQSKRICLSIAQSDIESDYAHQMVIEMALQKRAQILENKLELREQMKADALRMIEENEKLKQELLEKRQKAKQEQKSETAPNKLNPFIEKLWSDRQ